MRHKDHPPWRGKLSVAPAANLVNALHSKLSISIGIDSTV